MKKMLLMAVLGVFGILFIEYQVQKQKNKIVFKPTVSSTKALNQIGKIADLFSVKQDNDDKRLDKSLNLSDIDKKIKLYNKELSKYASLNFEQFSETQLKLFSQLNIERAALLRQKVLLKYRKM